LRRALQPSPPQVYQSSGNDSPEFRVALADVANVDAVKQTLQAARFRGFDLVIRFVALFSPFVRVRRLVAYSANKCRRRFLRFEINEFFDENRA
jgi:hypothetical protein